MRSTAPPRTRAWRAHRNTPDGVPRAAEFDIAGRLYRLAWPTPRMALELLDRAQLHAWANTPHPRPDPLADLAADALVALGRAVSRELVTRAFAETSPGSGRFVPLADVYDEALGTNHLRLMKWVAVALDVYAERAHEAAAALAATKGG